MGTSMCRRLVGEEPQNFSGKTCRFELNQIRFEDKRSSTQQHHRQQHHHHRHQPHQKPSQRYIHTLVLHLTYLKLRLFISRIVRRQNPMLKVLRIHSECVENCFLQNMFIIFNIDYKINTKSTNKFQLKLKGLSQIRECES